MNEYNQYCVQVCDCPNPYCAIHGKLPEVTLTTTSMPSTKLNNFNNRINQNRFLTELYNDLACFYTQTHSPRHIDDLKGTWITSKDEQDAIRVVLDVLEDCGASTDPKDLAED